MGIFEGGRGMGGFGFSPFMSMHERRARQKEKAEETKRKKAESEARARRDAVQADAYRRVAEEKWRGKNAPWSTAPLETLLTVRAFFCPIIDSLRAAHRSIPSSSSSSSIRSIRSIRSSTYQPNPSNQWRPFGWLGT